MAKADYIVNWEDAEVHKNGELLATFNTSTHQVTEYHNGGDKSKRWIKEAIKEAPPAQPAVDDKKIKYSDVEAVRFGRANIYTYFPNAPKPANNKVGFDHPEIYDWFSEEHPDFVEVLYPRGKWNSYQAAQSGLKTVQKGGANIGPR